MDGSNASRRSYRRTVAVIAVAGTMLVATAADAAVGVLTKRRAQETAPGGDRVGGKLFIGWSQAPRSHPKRKNVLVRRGSRKPIRLNRRSTTATWEVSTARLRSTRRWTTETPTSAGTT